MLSRTIFILIVLLALLAVVACGESAPEEPANAQPLNAEATETPEPTNTPEPRLGVSAQNIEALFAKEGFTFSNAKRSNSGNLTSGGLSPNGIVNLSLVGPRSDLTRTEVDPIGWTGLSHN